MSRTALIAESNSMFAETLVNISSLLGFKVVATTSDQAQVQELIEKFMPDLLIYDFNLSDPYTKGFNDLKPLKKKFPNMKIFVLGFHDAIDEIEKLIRNAGFDGYCNKFESRDGFISKLKHLFS